MKWYITWERPKMIASAGAFWPVMAIRRNYHSGEPFLEKDIKNTITHEETHMKTQLWMLLLPWLVIYMIFLVTHGYLDNPFERHARYVSGGGRYNALGWIKFIRHE